MKIRAAVKHLHSFPGMRYAVLLGGVLLLCSCAQPAGAPPSAALREQLAEIRQQQQEQALQMQQLQQHLAQLQQQLLAEDTISAKIQGNLESPTLREDNTVTSAAPPVAPGQFSVNQEITDLASSASIYLAAFASLAAGRPAPAETGFEQFLSNFPDHQYAPNARYWLASAQLSQGKTEPAIDNLRRIIADPRGRDKAPAALAQLANLYRHQGLSIQADEVLEQLRNRYPGSPEAQHFYRSDEPTQ